VLDRFYRVPGTPSKGSGLGLAIVKQIAIAHHSELGLVNTIKGLQASLTFAEV
jgi:signal transduction histidine kinase